MSDEVYKSLKRNLFFSQTTEFGPPTGKEHFQDYRDYHLPLAQMHHANLHGWGIARGLELSGTVGSSTITVQPGVAIDQLGQLIALSAEGSAAVGRTKPTNEADKVKVPVTLRLQLDPETPEEHTVYLTIQFEEILLPKQDGAGPRLEQVPWLRLQPASGPGAFEQSSPGVILGILEVDATGKLKGIKAQDPDLPYGRRLLGQRVSEVSLRRTEVQASGLTEVEGGKLGLGEQGGLKLTVPKVEDEILLAQEKGGNLARLEVKAESTRLYGTLSVDKSATCNGPLTVTGATALGETLTVTGVAHLNSLTVTGNVGIGTSAPNEKLVVTGGRIGQLEAGRFGDSWSKWAALGVPNPGLLPTHANYYGLKVQWDSDSVVFGLKDYGANRKDAIIAWGDDANDNLRFLRPNDAEAMIITGGGNVGIGTDTPNRQLTIQGQTGTYVNVKAENGSKEVLLGADRGGGIVSTMTNDDLQLRAGGNNTKMTIKANGNVGIGTSNPLQKLHVAGNFLCVDGAGNEQVYIGGDGKGNDVQLGSFKQDVTNVVVWNETTKIRMNLLVDNLYATGNIDFKGKLIGGGKGGYVMDQFMNNRGEALEQGDVVVIGKNQTSLFYGQDNTIPVPEVDLAQQAYDTRVCGIVSEVYTESKEISESLNIGTTAEETAPTKVTHQTTSETVPSQTFTAEELSSLDRTKIEPGQIGWMVVSSIVCN